MKVREIMTTNPKACTPTTTLSEAAGLMWDEDCGVLPVVADGGRIVGLITDRDICMAAALKNRNLSNIAVDEVISGKVHSTTAEADVQTALGIMREQKIRRLAVVGDDQTLEGIVSMNDIVLNAEENKGKKSAISYADVVNTYKAICGHRHPLPQPAQAVAAAI
jgi:CBS domain-containing protein